MKVNARGVNTAVEIGGKRVPFLRGKSVRNRPLVARVSELNRHRVSAQFHSDIFFVDDKPYLLSVLMPNSFGIVTYLSGRRTVAAV